MCATLTYFRDQSCTDILHLYHKLRSEVSSEEEATVNIFSLNLFCFCLHLRDCLCKHLCLCCPAGWLGHWLWHSRNIYRTSGKDTTTSTVPQIYSVLKTSVRASVLIFSWQDANSNSKKRGVALDVKAWRAQCRELVRRMTASPDSEPFRQPVDLFEYPVRQPETL